jgi:hypothetical protein
MQKSFSQLMPGNLSTVTWLTIFLSQMSHKEFFGLISFVELFSGANFIQLFFFDLQIFIIS